MKLSRYTLITVLLAVVTGIRAEAHEGPPFEIINDSSPPYNISVWSDPDIGIGTFFVVLEPLGGGDFVEPDSVVIHVAPVSARHLEAGFHAGPQKVRYGARYYAEVPFDSGGYWNVRVQVAGANRIHEMQTEVEATPDGSIGPIGLLIYLVPFLLVGFLWLKAFLRRREAREEGVHGSGVQP